MIGKETLVRLGRWKGFFWKPWQVAKGLFHALGMFGTMEKDFLAEVRKMEIEVLEGSIAADIEVILQDCKLGLRGYGQQSEQQKCQPVRATHGHNTKTVFQILKQGVDRTDETDMLFETTS